MKIVRASRPLTSTACRFWAALALSSTLAGPDRATVDRDEVLVAVTPGPRAEAAFEEIRARLFAYDIFPPWFMQGVIWPDGPVAEGALIVQRARFGSLAIEMAVRVVEVWDEVDGTSREVGFRYATIQGHAERGVASFAVHRNVDGHVTVVLSARSRPGNRAAVLGRPVARLLQRYMTRAAVRRLCAAGVRAASRAEPCLG